MDRGAIVSAQLTSEYYKQSPTVQRGMEIPYKSTVKISGTYINLSSMKKYKQLKKQLYIEPKNDEILVSFLKSNENIDSLSSHATPKKPQSKEEKYQ